MNDIIKILEPTIKTKPIEFSPQYVDGQKIDSAGEKLGMSSPYIAINTLAFWDTSILKFDLTTDNFLPKCSFIIHDINKGLSNEFMPIDDIACVFIRSDNTDFSSIRLDFKIISFQKISEDVYSIDSILYIPNLFNDEIFGHKGTSFSCLKKIAEVLGLGFASNIQDTNDSMYHICSNINYKDFICDEVMSYIYKDDKSFFICYIDQWYYLTLVEANSLFKKDIELNQSSFVNGGAELHKEKDKFIELLFLSNLPESDGRPNFINKYEIMNEGGTKAIMNGYRQNVIYYDKDNKNHEQYFVEALTTEGIDADDRVIKGERNEDYTKNIRNIHFESFFLENCHENYCFAKVFNKLNLQEIDKFKVRFYMSGVNFGLMNYMIIPIHISNNDRVYADINGDNNDVSIPLSGNYIISGMNYSYDIMSGVGATKLEFIGRKREIRKKHIDETI